MLQMCVLEAAEFKFYKRPLDEMEAFRSVISSCPLLMHYAKRFIKI